MKRFEQASIFAWTFVALSPLLSSFSPAILWAFTGMTIATLALRPAKASDCYRLPGWMLMFSFGLVTAILFAAVARPHTGYDLEQAAKLALILLTALPLAVRTEWRRQALWAGCEAALYANATAIAAGVVVSPAFFSLQGFARFGTCLAGPGSLWRVGATGIAAAFRIASPGAKWARRREMACLAISIILIAVDGSRTGMLVAGIAALVGLFHLLRSVFRRPLAAIVTGGCLFAGAALAYQNPAVNEAIETYGVIARIQDSINSSSAGGVSAEEMDSTRSTMLNDVLSAIEEHPLIGSGMGTTMTQTDVGLMVVHFSYLQVWADTGALGFLSYALLMGSGIWLALRHRFGIGPSGHKVPWYGAYLACGWALAGCFHPISTEPSEWIWYVLIVALVAEYPRSSERKISTSTPTA